MAVGSWESKASKCASMQKTNAKNGFMDETAKSQMQWTKHW